MATPRDRSRVRDVNVAVLHHSHRVAVASARTVLVVSPVSRVMGLSDWLPGFGSEESPESNPGSYRCLRCQTYHDRAYHTCPDCGSRFVAPIDPEAEEADVEGGDDVRRLPEDSEWKYG
jgi:rRNA maturation endonuclease Nob1